MEKEYEIAGTFLKLENKNSHEQTFFHIKISFIYT